MKNSLRLMAFAMAVSLFAGCGDETPVSPAWEAMCTAFCGRVLWCVPEASASVCRSVCLDEFKGIPCEADPELLDDCIKGIKDLSCGEIGEGEIPQVCERMCTGGLCEGVQCDDENECTDDLCNPINGSCETEPMPDGTPCERGGCEDGVCTSAFSCSERGIRAAVATGSGPYTFACDGPTTVTTDADIIIDNDVKLDGEGNFTLDGADQHRLFIVLAGVEAELHGFVLTRGRAEQVGEWHSPPPEGGGAVHNAGTLLISDSTVSNSTAPRSQYSLGRGGGIANTGTLTLANSVVSGNEAGHGGGVMSEGTLTVMHSTVTENTGGGVFSWGTLTMTDSTISSNQAASGGSEMLDGGGLVVSSGGPASLARCTVSENTARDGGGIYSHGTLTVTDSFMSQNDASGFGGGIKNDGELTLGHSTLARNSAGSGGGVFNYLGTSSLVALTVSGNSAVDGGGIGIHGGTVTLMESTVFENTASGHGGGVYSAGFLIAMNSTISGNEAGYEGGGINSDPPMVLIHMTVSGNSAGIDGDAIFATGPDESTVTNSVIDGDCRISAIVSGGYNIESPGDTCGFDQTGDQAGVPDPMLGELADNGGPTMTHALLPGSDAIDQVPVGDCLDADGAPLATDQRGEPRPAGSRCDVGAFERQPEDP